MPWSSQLSADQLPDELVEAITRDLKITPQEYLDRAARAQQFVLVHQIDAVAVGRGRGMHHQQLFPGEARMQPFQFGVQAEEAVEVVIDAMNGDREAVVRESADLLYNLMVLWVASDLRPADVWSEMKRREDMMGIAEKLPKNGGDMTRRKVVLLDSRRSRKRR